MPIYQFRNKKTSEIEEHQMRMSELDDFKKNHPKLKQVILSPPKFNYSTDAGCVSQAAVKKDKGWGEVLAKIGEQNPHSPLAQEHHRNKSINRIKAETIVDKHVKIQAADKKRWAAEGKI